MAVAIDDGSDGSGDWQRCQRNNDNNASASATRVLKPAQQLQRRQQQRQCDRQQTASATKGQEGGQEEWGGGHDMRQLVGGQGTVPSDGWCSFLRLMCDPEFSRRSNGLS